MKKIFSFVLALLAVTLSFSLFACSGTNFSYWQTEGKTSDGLPLTYYCELSFDSSKNVAQVWINVSELKPEMTTLEIVLKQTNTTKKTLKPELTKSVISDNKKNSDGWMSVAFDGDAVSCNRVAISVTDELRFNEIVLFDDEGKQIELSFLQGGVKAGDSSENVYDKDTLSALEKDDDPAYSEHPAFNIIDEQDSFPEKLLNK